MHSPEVENGMQTIPERNGRFPAIPGAVEFMSLPGQMVDCAGPGEGDRCPTGEALYAEIDQMARSGKKLNVELGIKVHQLRQTIPDGAWMEKWAPANEPAFGIDKAEDLDKIGACYGKLNSADRPNLPSALGTLRELAKLPLAAILHLLQEERIKRKMTEEDAKALVRESTGTPPAAPPAFSLEKWKPKALKLLGAIEERANPEDRKAVAGFLRGMADRLEGKGQIR